MTHRFSAVLERSDNRLWGAHLQVPARVARAILPSGRRVLCSLNGSPERQCALIPAGGGRYVVTVNKSLRQHLGISFGDEVKVTLAGDASRYGLPVPEELAALFRQDPEGRALFHALTPGRQRTLLYMIGQPGTSALRAERAVIVVRHLKSNRGTLDYRQLHARLKKEGRVGPP